MWSEVVVAVPRPEWWWGSWRHVVGQTDKHTDRRRNVWNRRSPTRCTQLKLPMARRSHTRTTDSVRTQYHVGYLLLQCCDSCSRVQGYWLISGHNSGHMFKIKGRYLRTTLRVGVTTMSTVGVIPPNLPAPSHLHCSCVRKCCYLITPHSHTRTYRVTPAAQLG